MKRNHTPFIVILILLALLAGLILYLIGRDRLPAPTAVPEASEFMLPAGSAEAAPEPTLPPETPSPEDAALEAEIRACLPDAAEQWDIYYESLSDGRFAVVQQNLPADHRMVSASLIKLFVMGAVYQADADGLLDADAQSADLRSMITASDNSAANRLITLLGGGDAAAGMERVNRFAGSMGCADTQLNRLMLVENGLQNYTSARDCAAFLRAVEAGTCVSAQRSEEMMTMLLGQTVNNRIPQQLPAGTAVAHKTGDLQHLSCGDVGIVLAPSGSYLLCIISNQSADDYRTAQTAAAISLLVYAQAQEREVS